MTWRRAAAALLLLAAGAAHAGSFQFCAHPTRLTAVQQDRLFAFAALVRSELASSAGAAALVSRSGQDLQRFGQRYSHAGISLRDGGDTPWSVRQLYFDCDDRVPRLFDQGIAGFVLGMDDPGTAWVSIVVLPEREALRLGQRARDDRLALALLGADYSANAYPFSVRYQNCNQWLAEMIAAAWGGNDDRADAQRWLHEHGYKPTRFDTGTLLLTLARPFVPWIHGDDHPPADRAAGVDRVSMPASIEAFVHGYVPGAARIELCQRDGRAVVRRGWEPIADGCVAAAGDRVIVLDLD